MPRRGGKKEGAEEARHEDEDEGEDGLLHKGGEPEDEDAEGEGAGLLPMDAEKTLAMVMR